MTQPGSFGNPDENVWNDPPSPQNQKDEYDTELAKNEEYHNAYVWIGETSVISKKFSVSVEIICLIPELLYSPVESDLPPPDDTPFPKKGPCRVAASPIQSANSQL